MKKRILQLLMLFCFTAFSGNVLAQVNVTGVVYDDIGGLLPGVNIVIKGTDTGIVTDFDGKFSITVPNETSVLMFSYLGMITQQITVGNQTIIEVTLESSSNTLDEVVVTALGISRDKKALGYSVATLKNDDINQGGDVNMLKSLEGKVTGVNIVNLSQDPTSSVLVNIRGATSIAGLKGKNSSNATQPLYVIDGIPVGSGRVTTVGGVDTGNIMSELNPEDIESITVLKGASAAALYGSEAGNGVIMITTKTGANAAKGIGVNFTSSAVFDDAYRPTKVLNNYFAGGRADDYSINSGSQWGAKVGSDFAVNNYFLQWDMTKQEYYNGPLRQLTDENRVEAFMQTGSTITNSLGVTGNYDKGNYRLSLTNLRNTGVIPNTATNRNTVSFNSLYHITNKVSVSSNVSYTRTHVPNKAVGVGRNERSGLVEILQDYAPNHQPMDEMRLAQTWINGYEGTKQNTAILSPSGEPLNRLDDNVSTNNPYFVTENIIREYVRQRAFGKIQLDWQMTDYLSFTARSGVDLTTFHFQQRVPWDSQNRRFGKFDTRNNESTKINTDLILTFNKQYGKFDITANAGYNYRFDENISTGMGGDNLARPNDFSIGAIAKTALNTDYIWYTGKFQSLYGTATVGYDNMLYLDITGRNDWAGITEQQKNSYFYPSVSLSWIASETFDLPDWFTYAKARGGIAQVGHGIGTFPNANFYGFNGQWNGASLGTVGGPLVDPDIDPEINTSYEFGIDLAFLENRIVFDITTFNKKHENQIDNIPVVNTTGFSSLKTNVGTVESTGIESSLTLVPVKSTNWKWSITGNFTKFEAEVTELKEGFNEIFSEYAGAVWYRLAEGETVGNLYAKIPYHTVAEGEFAGQKLLYQDGYVIEDQNTKADRQLLGNYNPDYVIGINTTLRYKRFNLNVVARYRQGGVYSSETMRGLRGSGKTPYTLSGDGVWWEGGREGEGGFTWPNPADIPNDVIRNQVEQNYRADINDASYYVGVYVDPRSGADELDTSLGGQTWDDNGVQRPYYIQNGADPLWTLYNTPSGTMDQWQFSQTRTFSATNFKIKEITLSYNFPSSFTEKFKCHTGSFSLLAKNVYFWNKSGLNEDPESSFADELSRQGVARNTMPAIRSFGAKLNLNF